MQLLRFLWGKPRSHGGGNTLDLDPKHRDLNLSEWLRLRSYSSSKAILDAVSASNGKIAPGALNDDVLVDVIQSSNTLSELIAAATLVRRYGDRGSDLPAEYIAKKMSSFGDISSCANAGTPRSISLVSAASEGAHLKLILSYAAALGSADPANKVNIIFTAEWEWARWKSGERNRYRDSIKERLRALGSDLPPDLFDRISVIVAPDRHEYSKNLGDIVFRFEGVSAFKTTWLFSRSVASKLPVITVTFSSMVSESGLGYRTIVRSPRLAGQNSIYFEQPLLVNASELEEVVYSSKNRNSIVTVYSGDRIAAGLAKLSVEQWGKVADLLRNNPDLKWLLVGASHPDEASRAIPSWIAEDSIADRIKVLGFSDLGAIYEESLAFLCFEGMFGGGGGSTAALVSGVPILTYSEERSDVSNFIDVKFHQESFTQAVDKISEWLKDPGAWRSFIAGQRARLLKRADLKSKGEELMSIIEATSSDWQRAGYPSEYSFRSS